MSSERLYLGDAYRVDCTTRVLEARQLGRKQALRLEHTIFQPRQRDGGDRGVVELDGGVLQVSKVVEEGGGIEHRGRCSVLPAAGSQARCVLDWEHRYSILRRHTASHLLYGCAQELLADRFAALSKTGARTSYTEWLGQAAKVDEGVVHRIFERANALVEEGRSVRARELPRAEAFAGLDPRIAALVPASADRIRLVTIAGLAPDPCIGLHVRDIREIGPLTLERVERRGEHLRVFPRLEESR